MSQLIMQAVVADANAKEAKAIANLNNYMTNAVGVGEHPDVVSECTKLIKEIAEAREIRTTVEAIVNRSTDQNQSDKKE